MFENLEPGERLIITFPDPDRYRGGVNFLGFPVLMREGTGEVLQLNPLIEADTLTDPTDVLMHIHEFMQRSVGGLKPTFECAQNSAKKPLPEFKYGLGTIYGREFIRNADVTHIIYVLEAACVA